ncbi:MAG: hypothetical protein H6551_13150 [Chitinophagales bacterium]|nr:hypothetical protein [Chitinophagaceae bacterium]MCB9066079.1 hypothetical protein [Chitinophagales bacterium]
MRLKVLLTGKDENAQIPDAEMLRDRGFLVYRCEEEVVDDMIDELHPDILIINPLEKDNSSTSLYNRLLSSIKYARLPLIYTLSEDDVYLVNRKRTAIRGMRNFIVDNIIDGIKTALASSKNNNRELGFKLAG